MPWKLAVVAALGLAAAYRTGDRERIADQGVRLSGDAIARGLASADRAETLGALAAAPLSRSAWRALPQLGELARDPDRRLAATAAARAAEIALGLTEQIVEVREISADALRAEVTAWTQLSAERWRWADIRVHALETATALQRLLPARSNAPVAGWPEIANDPDPELRRAALELIELPLSRALRQELTERFSGESDPVVALVAAQTLCLGLAFDGTERSAFAELLGAGGVDRVAALRGDRDAPPAAVRDLERCIP